MANNNINNCSNINNNQINNNKSEVKTMRKITNNTINFNANALNSSIIASAISYEGNGYDGFLFGDDVNFGPNVTIVTPIHPMLPGERNRMIDEEGKPARLCYAKPVTIGSNIWFGANVVVCSGVTIGDNAVVAAGSVVIRDVPANALVAGNPARVIRLITEADRAKYAWAPEDA